MGSLAGLPDPVWLAAGLAGVFLTAYYSFRLIFILLFPREDALAPCPPAKPAGIPAGDHNAHASRDRAMAGPLIILAAVTVILGFFETPLNHFLGAGLMAVVRPGGTHPGRIWPHWLWLLSGVGLAWVEFGRKRREADRFCGEDTAFI